MRRTVSGFACGALFAVGLALSGMTSPARVTGFLDVTGAWDASLALVMGGALAVLFLAQRTRRARPLLAPSFARLPATTIDARLVGGSALFGVGWGLSGYCPGPALASLATGGPGVLAFVTALGAGTFLVSLLERRASEALAAPTCG